MKRSEDIVKNSQNGEILPFVVLFSKTANMASRIIKKHFTLLKDHDEFEDYEYQIISVYSKHKNISDVLLLGLCIGFLKHIPSKHTLIQTYTKIDLPPIATMENISTFIHILNFFFLNKSFHPNTA